MNEKPYTTAGGDVARPAGSPGDSLLSDAKNAVGNIAEGAKEQVVTRVESQKDKAAEKIGSVAGALRGAAEPLAEMGPLPDLAGRAADQIESIAEYVQSRTVGDIVHEVERFARREPAIFLGAAFGLGLLAGRFLKSSPRRVEIHPEIQDTDFEEQIAFGDTGYGVQGRFERQTYGTQTSGSSGSTWGERSVERNNPGIDRTASSGFGGYGGSYATGNSSAYDVGGSSVSAKPTSDLSSGNAFTRNEGPNTKPMGTMGSSTVSAATPATSSTAGSSSSTDAGGLKPIADSPLTTSTTGSNVGSTTAPMPTASTATAGNTANKTSNGSTSNGSTSNGSTANGSQRSSGRP